jgi:ankyrin repeat protein
MIATLHGHDTIVRKILSHSLDKTKTIELEGRTHSVNGDLVNKVTALWCALDRAHFNVARTLIDLGKANVNHGPLHPLLIDATIRGRLDIIQFLIENDYTDVNQTKTNDENTALAVAAMKGHLELVRVLSMAGASSRTINHAKKTPIVLAAENNKFDVMNYLLEHDHNNASFDDLELVAASHIFSQKGTEHYKSQWVIELLRQSLLKRTEFNIPKSVAEPIAIYDFQQECQSIDEFDQIQDNDDRLYIEALLIQERILLSQKDEKLFTLLFERATTLVEEYQFDLCLDLILHIFHLSQQFQFQNYFKQFFWLFYNMFNSNSC